MMHSNRHPDIVNLSTPTRLNRDMPGKIGIESPNLLSKAHRANRSRNIRSSANNILLGIRSDMKQHGAMGSRV